MVWAKGCCQYEARVHRDASYLPVEYDRYGSACVPARHLTSLTSVVPAEALEQELCSRKPLRPASELPTVQWGTVRRQASMKPRLFLQLTNMEYTTTARRNKDHDLRCTFQRLQKPETLRRESGAMRTDFLHGLPFLGTGLSAAQRMPQEPCTLGCR